LDNRPNPSGTFIHSLDQDSLLHIFYLCRPVLLDEDETNNIVILQGGIWTRERWWYKLVQVCRRWRYLILDSAHHLRLSLVVSRGTPVVEMLEHYPPLPLTIDYVNHSYFITTEAKEGIIDALKHRDRVRHIRLDIPVLYLQQVIMALEGEFPILEFMWIGPTTELDTSLILPKSLRAPYLRHLGLSNFALPIGSPLLTTSMSLTTTLFLDWIRPSGYFHPNDLVHRLSQMPRLEILGISFHPPGPNLDVNEELLPTQVTLPNLRWFSFQGAGAYLEALLPCMTAPLLAKLLINFFNPLTFHLPHLVRFLHTAENLRFSRAKLHFRRELFYVTVYPDKEARVYALSMAIICRHLNRQVASAAQILSVLRSAFSAVENLTLKVYVGYGMSSEEWLNEADRTQWRDLLGPFSNVKTFQVSSGLVSQLSRSLQVEGGESPVELLPELKELSYNNCSVFDDAFGAFIDARRIAGRPVTVVRS